MKRLTIILNISILLLVVCPFNIFASENFVLRNDIHFCDNIETVAEKEGLDIENVEVDETDDSIKYLESDTCEIASIPGCIIKYIFENDELIEMDYCYEFSGLYISSRELIERLGDVYDKLYEKYGLEFDADNIDDSYFKTSLYETYLAYKEREENGKPIQIVNYNGCLVDNKDYGVKIETLTIYSASDNMEFYWPYIAYKYITPDEMKDYANKLEDYTNGLDNDL